VSKSGEITIHLEQSCCSKLNL